MKNTKPVYLTVKELKDACKNYPYILVRFKSGTKMGVNTKVADIALKRDNYYDGDFTSFVSFTPCDFQTYITYKHGFC